MRRVRLNGSYEDPWKEDVLADQLADTLLISDKEFEDSIRDFKSSIGDMYDLIGWIIKYRHEKYSFNTVTDEQVNRAIELVNQFQQNFTDFMVNVDYLNDEMQKLHTDIKNSGKF